MAAALANPANALTLARVPLAFAFLACYSAAAAEGGRVLLPALAAAAAIEVTDLADGFVARRLGCVTDFGKLVDPFCDAFARLLVFFTIAASGFAGGAPLVPLWVPAVLLLRDLAVAFVRTVSAAGGVVVAARASGKWKALVQGPAILGIVGCGALAPGLARAVAPWAALAAALVTGWSLVDYVWASRAALAGLGARASAGASGVDGKP